MIYLFSKVILFGIMMNVVYYRKIFTHDLRTFWHLVIYHVTVYFKDIFTTMIQWVVDKVSNISAGDKVYTKTVKY